MSSTTANLDLTLPAEADSYDVNVTNGNFEKVDRAVGELQNNSATQETLNGISANVESVKSTAEANGEKADVLQVYTESIKATVEANAVNIERNGNNVNTANTNISSVKSTVENTSGKVDTAITNIEATKSAVESNGTKLDTLQAQTEVKPFGWTKKATIGSGAWQTAVEITGRGTIAKALSLADAAYQMRITIDDEVVLYCNGLKGKWAGTIEDFASNSNSVYTPVMFYDGIVDIVMLNSSDCVWYIGCPGADVISAAVCFVSGGLRFYKNFKLEFYNLQPGAVTVTGTITKGSTVTTL